MSSSVTALGPPASWPFPGLYGNYFPYDFGDPPPAHVKWVANPAASQVTPPPKIDKLSSFHLFNKLSLELRLRIWALAIPQGRVLEIRSWETWGGTRQIPSQFTVGPHEIPAILHVNQESRKEALRHYQLVKLGFAKNIRSSNVPNWSNFLPDSKNQGTPRVERPKEGPPALVYIDFSRDIIYLGPEFLSYHLEIFLSSLYKEIAFAGLQYLALGKQLWIYRDEYQQAEIQEWIYGLRTRPLKEVYIVTDDHSSPLPVEYYKDKHELSLQEPDEMFTLTNPDIDIPDEATFVESMNRWFTRLWGEKDLMAPNVKVMSVRRNGKQMSEFRRTVWELQFWLREMESWKDWIPKPPIDMFALLQRMFPETFPKSSSPSKVSDDV